MDSGKVADSQGSISSTEVSQVTMVVEDKGEEGHRSRSMLSYPTRAERSGTKAKD